MPGKQAGNGCAVRVERIFQDCRQRGVARLRRVGHWIDSDADGVAGGLGIATGIAQIVDLYRDGIAARHRGIRIIGIRAVTEVRASQRGIDGGQRALHGDAVAVIPCNAG